MYTELHLKVFYLWDFGVNEQKDPGFETAFTWDVPLLRGISVRVCKKYSTESWDESLPWTYESEPHSGVTVFCTRCHSYLWL